MSKILKNQTAAPIAIGDVGNVIVPVLPATYVIPPQDWLLWAGSSDICTEVGAGNIVVSDSLNDLSISDGIDLIKFICCNKAEGVRKQFIGTIDPTVDGANEIIDETCPAATDWILDRIYVSGLAEGCVRVLKDSDLIGFGAIGAGDYNVSIKFDNEEPIAAAERLRVIFDQDGDCEYLVRAQVQYREFT